MSQINNGSHIAQISQGGSPTTSPYTSPGSSPPNPMIMSQTIPSSLREILTKLEFLAMIGKGKKPCMVDKSFVDSDSWYGALKRTVMGEGRKGMMIQINETIDLTIDAINQYQETEFIFLIVESLRRAKNGICNLKSSYINRPEIIADINVCLSNIQLQLDKINISADKNTKLIGDLALNPGTQSGVQKSSSGAQGNHLSSGIDVPREEYGILKLMATNQKSTV